MESTVGTLRIYLVDIAEALTGLSEAPLSEAVSTIRALAHRVNVASDALAELKGGHNEAAVALLRATPVPQV